MATRSTRLWGPVLVAVDGDVLLGPLGDTVLIKNVRVVRAAVTQVPVLVKYGINGLADGQLLAAVELDSGPMVWTDGTWLVLEPGETLQMITSQGTVTTSGHGTILTGGGEFP